MFRILVAEDDESTRLLMCEVLRQAGYEPCPAKDGVEALEVMEHYQCDLAVVDITMPRMDGIAFTQTLREGNCDLPVLMVTARVTQEDKRRGFRALPQHGGAAAAGGGHGAGSQRPAGHHPTGHGAADGQGVHAAVQAPELPADALYQAAAH